MSFENAYKRTRYIETARHKLQQIYSLGEQNPRREKHRDQLEGYFKAGLLLGIIEEIDITTLVDQEHHLAYGTTLEERQMQDKLPEQKRNPIGQSMIHRLSNGAVLANRVIRSL